MVNSKQLSKKSITEADLVAIAAKFGIKLGGFGKSDRSEFADHGIRVLGKSEAEKLDNRVNSIWFGAANKLKQRAFDAAMALAM